MSAENGGTRALFFHEAFVLADIDNIWILRMNVGRATTLAKAIGYTNVAF